MYAVQPPVPLFCPPVPLLFLLFLIALSFHPFYALPSPTPDEKRENESENERERESVIQLFLLTADVILGSRIGPRAFANGQLFIGQFGSIRGNSRDLAKVIVTDLNSISLRSRYLYLFLLEKL